MLIGTGAEDTREAVALSREAETLGADGVMVIPPLYSVPTDDQLYVQYRTIADAIGIPVMVYINPATANVDLTPPLLARLSTIEGCRYVKESTLDVTRGAQHHRGLRRADGGVRRHAGLRKRLAGCGRLGGSVQQRGTPPVARSAWRQPHGPTPNPMVPHRI